MMEPWQQKAVREALSWEGTPYVHQARGPKGRVGGIDCVGLLVCVAGALGLKIEDSVTYSRTPTPEGLLDYMRRSCVRLSRPDEPLVLCADEAAPLFLSAGRIALFWFSTPAHPQHAGLLTSERMMVHTHAGSSLNEVDHVLLKRAWLNRLHSVWEYREMA